MPVYRNVKTGAEFFTCCECKGADIVLVPSAPAEEKPAPAQAKKPARKKTANK